MAGNNRDNKIAVFQDTIYLCETNDRLKMAVHESVAAQRLIPEQDAVPELSGNPEPSKESGLVTEPTNIIVSQKRTLEAASAYPGQRVCVLNFASATNPGGGVTRGSSAQEECLCRCSTLYPCINEPQIRDGFHYRHRRLLKSGDMDALYNDDCIFTPGVIAFKSDTALPRLLPEQEWFCVDVITCAAPNLREVPGNAMNPGSYSRAVRITDSELAALHEKRANRILDIAKAHRAEVVILGAFGCGAFRNPPAVVVAGIRKAVESHRMDFRTIEFAVYCPPRDSSNYDEFSRMFG